MLDIRLTHNGIKLARINPLKPEFTTVIFIHYKPRVEVSFGSEVAFYNH